MNGWYTAEMLDSIYEDVDYSYEVKRNIKAMVKMERMRRRASAERLGMDFDNDITEKCLIFTDK